MTVVVSPLIALITDQVAALKAKNIPTEALNSKIIGDERKKIMNVSLLVHLMQFKGFRT